MNLACYHIFRVPRIRLCIANKLPREITDMHLFLMGSEEQLQMPNQLKLSLPCFSNERLELCNEVDTVNAALTKMPPTSGVVPRIDAELFHPGKKSRSVYAHARGGSVGAADTSLRFSECTHNRIALILCALVVNATICM